MRQVFEVDLDVGALTDAAYCGDETNGSVRLDHWVHSFLHLTGWSAWGWLDCSTVVRRSQSRGGSLGQSCWVVLCPSSKRWHVGWRAYFRHACGLGRVA